MGASMSSALRCLLISANTVTNPYPVYPLGMAHVAGALRAAGHQVRQYDILVDGIGVELANCIQEFDPQLIGIAIRNIDTVDSADQRYFLGDAQACMEFIRSQTVAPVVIGGSGFTIFPEELMVLLKADYGLVGEGESGICQLASDLCNGYAPEVGTLLTGDGIVTKTWPAVAYDPHIAAYYAKHGGMMNIQTKRGCPFMCSYCSYPALEGRKYRYRDP